MCVIIILKWDKCAIGPWPPCWPGEPAVSHTAPRGSATCLGIVEGWKATLYQNPRIYRRFCLRLRDTHPCFPKYTQTGLLAQTGMSLTASVKWPRLDTRKRLGNHQERGCMIKPESLFEDKANVSAKLASVCLKVTTNKYIIVIVLRSKPINRDE